MTRALVERCARIPTSTWSDALDQLGLPGVLTGLHRRAGAFPFAGPAVTVAEVVGPLGSAKPSEFGIDRILAAARPGDVVLIQQVGDRLASAVGGLAALAARRHGLAGIVIDGACRDLDELESARLPIVSRSTTPASGRGRVRIAGVNVLLRFDALDVAPRDLVVVDSTGVVVLPARRLLGLLALAEARAEADAHQAAMLVDDDGDQT